MGLRTRLRNWLLRSDDLNDQSDQSRWTWPYEIWYPRSRAGIAVGTENAMRVSACYACVRVLSETLAQLPIHVYERLPGNKKRLAEEHALNFLFLNPNGWQTWFELVEFSMGNLGFSGNCYAAIIAGPRGATTALRPLRADRMTVERIENGKLRYTFKQPETGRDTVYSQEEIFHVRAPVMSGDGLIGLAPVSAAREALGLSIAAEAHGATFFGNGARPGFAFSSDQPIKKDAARETLEAWNSVHKGSFNANKPAILPFGLKPVTFGMSNEDSQFLETRRFQVEEIARIYRVPLHLINDLTKSTNNNIEHQSLEFVMYTMLPWIRRWEQAIGRDLIADSQKFYVKFEVDGLLRGDSKSRSEFYSKMINSGVFDINTALELEDMNPIPNGDVHLVQGAMTTLERIINPPEPVAAPGAFGAPPAAAPAKKDGDEPDDEDRLRVEQFKNRELEVAVAKAQAQYDLACAKYGEECAETKRLLGELTVTLQVKAEAEREAMTARMTATIAIGEREVAIRRLAEIDQENAGLRDQHDRLAKQLDQSLLVTKEAAKHVAVLVRDAAARLLRWEIDGATRATNKPNFVQAIDEFYGEFEGRLESALEGPLALHTTLCGADVDPARIAREHVAESRQALLDAAECMPEDLEARIADCVSKWEPRADRLACQVLAAYEAANNNGDRRDGNSDQE